MKSILFLHGFFASGNCSIAIALNEALGSKYRIISPDLPMHPLEALDFIHKICDKEKPDLIVANSCGSFYAQILSPIVGVPALLGNPHFKMTEFLEKRIGSHQYKSPRADGNQDFTIDEQLIEEFRKVEDIQFNFTSPYYRDKICGIFGEKDTVAHFEETFLKYYSTSYHFPGAHTPTAEEVKTWYIPLIEKMIVSYEKPEARYFRHFKGGLYQFDKTAYDSESQDRMVIYRALYGEKAYWVRPEKMFFEKITRDGKTFNRFTEIDK